MSSYGDVRVGDVRDSCVDEVKIRNGDVTGLEFDDFGSVWVLQGVASESRRMMFKTRATFCSW